MAESELASIQIELKNPRRSYLDRPNSVLPYEIFSHLLSFTDTRSLCQLAETCHTLRNNPHLNYEVWPDRLQQDFKKSQEGDNPKKIYLEHHRKSAKHRAEMNRQSAKWLRHREYQISWLFIQSTRLLYVFQEIILPLAVPALTLTFTVLAMWHIDQHGWSAPLPWSAVTPLMVMVGVVLLAVLCACYVGRVQRPYPFVDASKNFLTLFRNVLEDAGWNNEEDRMWPAFFSGVLFVIFLALKWTATVSWSYAVVFAPFFAFLIFVVYVPLRRRDYDTACFVGLFLLPWLVQAILIIIRLEGTYIHLGLVMLPLWLMHAVVIVGFCAAWINENPLLSCCGWVFTGGAMFVFQVMLVVWVENDSSSLSWIKVAIPLLVWEAALLLPACFWAKASAEEMRMNINQARGVPWNFRDPRCCW